MLERAVTDSSRFESAVGALARALGARATPRSPGSAVLLDAGGTLCEACAGADDEDADLWVTLDFGPWPKQQEAEVLRRLMELTTRTRSHGVLTFQADDSGRRLQCRLAYRLEELDEAAGDGLARVCAAAHLWREAERLDIERC